MEHKIQRDTHTEDRTLSGIAKVNPREGLRSRHNDLQDPQRDTYSGC
jgi:hypothetical protein